MLYEMRCNIIYFIFFAFFVVRVGLFVPGRLSISNFVLGLLATPYCMLSFSLHSLPPNVRCFGLNHTNNVTKTTTKTKAPAAINIPTSLAQAGKLSPDPIKTIPRNPSTMSKESAKNPSGFVITFIIDDLLSIKDDYTNDD